MTDYAKNGSNRIVHSALLTVGSRESQNLSSTDEMVTATCPYTILMVLTSTFPHSSPTPILCSVNLANAISFYLSTGANYPMTFV
jgi:hypothetical protein